MRQQQYANLYNNNNKAHYSAKSGIMVCFSSFMVL